MAEKGSNANAPLNGNNIYQDLEMTRYPAAYDEREGAKLNMNMTRQTNLKDYNMAEHVNALQDAVMAVQRVLGEMVQVPADPKDLNGNPLTQDAINALARVNTVKDRLNSIERHDWSATFDKRYGGPTWSYTEGGNNATIQQHRHLGSASGIPGSPEKISLTQEVTGKLAKGNLNLAKSTTGLTGADVFVNASSDQKIADALNDKVSESQGGTIAQNATLNIIGKTNTRWTREFDTLDATGAGNSTVPDGKTLLGTAVESGANAASTLLNQKITGMYYGRYVAIVRIASSSLTSAKVLEIAARDSFTNAELNSVTLSGTDFDKIGDYKTFFLIFEHKGATNLVINKLNTVPAARIRFDYAIVEPVHPAVFDR